MLKDSIYISPNRVEYLGSNKLIQFEVTNVEMIQGAPNYIYVEITLRRMISYHVVSTFGPTLTLLMIAEVTLFISESHFEATIMLAITSMLVMYTLYQSASSSLPKTAYVKMIDTWLIFGLVVPFIIFLILTLIEMLNDDDDDKEPIDKKGDEKELTQNSTINDKLSATSKSQVVPKDVFDKEVFDIVFDSKLHKEKEGRKSKKQSTKRKIKAVAKVLVPAATILFIIGYVVVAVTIFE